MLPNDYLLRMKEILKDEYPLYLKTFDEPNVRAIKVNTNKITVDEFVKICPFSLENRNITISSYNENVKLDNITDQSFVCMFKNCIDNYIYNS